MLRLLLLLRCTRCQYALRRMRIYLLLLILVVLLYTTVPGTQQLVVLVPYVLRIKYTAVQPKCVISDR